MKQLMIESIESTREHFKDKKCNALGYFTHLEKEFRVRDMDKAADELHKLIMEKMKEGGI